MSPNLEEVLVAALVGLASWFVKDFLFGLVQKRDQLERAEWEYRLKELYCPLYWWSGLLTMQTSQQNRVHISERLQGVMAKAAYAIPKLQYYALVRLLEAAYAQKTSTITNQDRDRMRAYLYDQIEVLNLILYRSEATGGVGDPSTVLSPYRRLFRITLLALSHLMVWLLIALGIGGVLWLYRHGHFDVLGTAAILLLFLALVDTRRRADIQRGIAKRIGLEA